jgi:hypothetical protein
MFRELGALLKSHPVSGCLLLVVAMPVLMIVLALLPPLGFFLVSRVVWTAYFYGKK